MNESNFENLIKAYRKVQMTPEEKREVFKQSMLVIEKIEAVSLIHTDKKELYGSTFSNTIQEGKTSMTMSWMSYVKRRQFIPALVASFMLLFTGGASLLAEQALPGDSLYSFKIKVNEPLRDFTALTEEGKAKLAVEVTEKRLQEAAVLSAQGNLNEDNKKILQDQFVKRAEQIRNRVASLVSNNNLNAAQEVVVDFESALTTHELILESLSLGQTGTVVATVGASSTASIVVDSTSVTGTQVAITANAKHIAPKPEVTSLLFTLKNELDSTKASRINIQEKVLASFAIATSTSPSKINPAPQAVFDANIKELRFTIIDIQTELKAYGYAPSTVEEVSKRIEQASTSIAQIYTLAKSGMIAEAALQSRLALKNLAEVQVVLKIEKNSKASLDGKVDILYLLKNGSIDDSVASTTPSSTNPVIVGANATATTTVSDTIAE